MPYCNHCGAFVLDEDRFCPKCGSSQKSASAQAPAGPEPAAASPPGAPGDEFAAPKSPQGPPPPPLERTPAAAVAGLPFPANVAAMLCYIPGMGWVAAVIFLTIYSYHLNRYVRFHAFQGLFLAVVYLLASKLFFPFSMGDVQIFPFIGFRKLCLLLVIVAQVVGMIKTLQHQEYRLPVLGELVDKSMA